MLGKVLRRLAVVVALAALAVGGYYLYMARTRPPEFTFRTVKIDRGRVSARVSATGTLSAHVTVLVGSQVSGRLQRIDVDFNSTVKKGQVIAKIDPQIFVAAVAQARASAYAAQGNLAKGRAQSLDSERQLARMRALRADGLASQLDVDTAETNDAVNKAQIDALKGALEQARAGQTVAEVNLAYTDIISPIDGVVISRAVDVGQTVAASLSAPTLFTIAEDLRKMQVDTSVTEGDVGKLQPAMSATFVVDAYPTKKFSGTIRQIRNSATSVQNVVTYDAVIDVENPALELKPGMTANVTVVYAERVDVLVVPNAAMRFRPPASLALSASASGGAPSSSRSHGGQAGPDGSSGHGRWRQRDGGAPPADSGAVAADSSAAPAHSGAAHGHGGATPAHSGAVAGDAGAPVVPAGVATPRGGEERPQERRVVWVLRGATPTPVSVRTGLTDGTTTEILDGDLHEGDAVVLEALGEGDSAAPASSKPGAAAQPGGPRGMRF